MRAITRQAVDAFVNARPFKSGNTRVEVRNGETFFYLFGNINELTIDIMDYPEFKIGEEVTIDRYNHIDDVIKSKVIGYGSMVLSDRLTYRFNINGTIIETTGISIVESYKYVPVPLEDRHPRLNSKL